MLKKHKPLTVALDCDDVLMPCISMALEIKQKEYGFDPPLTLDEVTKWSPAGVRSDCILECFEKPSFFRKQRPYPGAQDFVRNLCDKAEVYITTAVPVCAMGIRTEMIKKYFPEIPSDHIVLTSSKDIVNIDVLLDDAPHNILSSKAKFPVAFRRPWNHSLTGILSVNNYDEFLILIDEIKNRFNDMEIDENKPCIVGLIGMSGSGKTALAQKLVQTGDFVQPKSYTDRKKRDTDDSYHFVSTAKFQELKNSGDIFESTVYSGHNYGSSAKAINEIIESGKNVVIPIDICGAISLKTHFKNVITVFVNRDKKDLITSVLKRDVSIEDKANRILSIDAEIRNAEICDYIINNNNDLDSLVTELLSVIGK